MKEYRITFNATIRKEMTVDIMADSEEEAFDMLQFDPNEYLEIDYTFRHQCDVEVDNLSSELLWDDIYENEDEENNCIVTA